MLVADDLRSSTNSNQSCINLFQKKKVHDVIMSSYLKPLSSQNNESKHTKLGRSNEKRLIDCLLKDTPLIRTNAGIGMCNTCDVGLVMHKNKKYLKTKADFLATMIFSLQTLLLLIIECKTRCTSSTES